MKALVEIDGSPPFQHRRDRTRQLMRQDSQGFALTLLFRQAREPLLARRMIPQAQHGGFGEGPLERGMADRRAGDPVACAGRFLGTRAHAAIRDNVLHAREPLHVMDLVEQDHTQDVPDAGYGAQEVQGSRTVLLGSGHEVSRQIAEALVVGAKQGEVHVDALLHGGIGTPLGHAVTGGLLGNLLPDLGQVVLTVGVLDVGQALGPCAREIQAAPEQIPGGAPLGRIHLGVGAHPATQEPRNLVRIERVVLGLAAMDRRHREGMAEDNREACLGPEVGQPGPR
jgi:hypothetical protein